MSDRPVGAGPCMAEYRFTGELWRHDGEAAWYFVTLPPDVSDDIDERAASATRGFGSVRVEVTIGSTTWRTSLFPDRRAGAFVLPVKRSVRTAEFLADGDVAAIALSIVDHE